MDQLPANPPAPISGMSRPQQVASAALSLILAALGLWTLNDFLPALAWAAIFAIALWPLSQRLRQRLPPSGHNVLLPLGLTACVALLFLVPLALVLLQVGHEWHTVMAWIHDARTQGIPPPAWLNRLPAGGPQIATWWQANLADPQHAGALLKRADQGGMVQYGRNLGSAVLHRMVLFGFTLLTLFFLFRDGPRLTVQMRRASRRAFGPEGERIARQMVASVHGTVDGLVLVGLGEGAVLGIAYAVAGVPHATLLGAVTAIAAVVPFGAPLAFGIAVLLLLAKGAVLAGIIILALGMAVTFAADHFIRPVLIGGATRLPFLWVLLGILGGLKVWGLLGLFLGPALMSALILLWREWAGE